MANLTKSKLERFIKIRNKGGFSSNLQFSIDATEAGFDVGDLGDPTKLEEGGYAWNTAHGKLIEQPNGQMQLAEAV
ncbi:MULTISPECIES: hypothetical protein [unclassified Novosphingobium]|uniref:hypothetical protein n=1 Tax=unclassified Novosphingobium TaxID=2644732 RepID=UPI0025FFAE6D|nr:MULTISPECIES: hypothetical protein [unclassified Novosphingobium]HQV04595.1 hypothetical protein [Novosphingobium sp.]